MTKLNEKLEKLLSWQKQENKDFLMNYFTKDEDGIKIFDKLDDEIDISKLWRICKALLMKKYREERKQHLLNKSSLSKKERDELEFDYGVVDRNKIIQQSNKEKLKKLEDIINEYGSYGGVNDWNDFE